MKRELRLDQLLKMSTDELMNMLQNNFCTGKGSALGDVYTPLIHKNIEGKWFIEYSERKNDTIYSKRKILFEVAYSTSIKVALAEALIRLEELKMSVLNE